MQQFYNNSGYIGYIYGYKIPNDAIFTYNELDLITDHINNNINNSECITILNRMFSCISTRDTDKYNVDLLQYETFKVMNVKNNSNDKLFIYIDNEKYEPVAFINKYFKQDISQSKLVLVNSLIEHSFTMGDM